MIPRAQIKQRAKDNFRLEYWPCVGAFIITIVIMLGAGAFSAIPIIGLAAPFLLMPLTVGACGFFLGVYRQDGDTSLGRLFNIAFSQNYGRKLGGMLWMELWIFLWSLIVIVPVTILVMVVAVGSFSSMETSLYAIQNQFNLAAISIASILCFAGMILVIIKTISYSMTPFILADCPDIPATETLRLSIRMTSGHKGEIFVMGLSFIGWGLLCSITFFMVGIFWAGPYMYTSYAGLYDTLKGNMIEAGVFGPVIPNANYNEPKPQQDPQQQQDQQPTQL